MILLAALVGCDERAQPTEQLPAEIEPVEAPATLTEQAPPPEAPALPATALALSTPGNRIAFDQPTLTAPAGPIRLTFTSAATEATLLHNVVVVPEGMADPIGIAGIDAGTARGYVPEHEAVLAASPLLSPGESAELLLTLQPGTYTFLCTFPGHHLTQYGVLSVTEAAPPSP